jgi:hypothetical protein
MRMWMVEPKHMCNRHLLGEHGELHKFLHNWRKQYSISGYVRNNCIEPLSYKARHDALAEEMIRRGMNHKSPIDQPDFNYLPYDELRAKVNRETSRTLLRDRCSFCKDIMVKS